MEKDVNLIRQLDLRFAPPGAPPFIPKTGPSEDSRQVMIDRLPMRSSLCISPLRVIVFPSPDTVGVIAVTRISFPGALNLPCTPSNGSRLSFAVTELRRA